MKKKVRQHFTVGPHPASENPSIDNPTDRRTLRGIALYRENNDGAASGIHRHNFAIFVCLRALVRGYLPARGGARRRKPCLSIPHIVASPGSSSRATHPMRLQSSWSVLPCRRYPNYCLRWPGYTGSHHSIHIILNLQPPYPLARLI